MTGGLHRSLRDAPDGPAGVATIRTDGAEVSRAELLRMVDAVRGRLGAAGLEPGDRLLVLLGNSIEYVATVLAALSAGIVVVPASVTGGRRRLERVVRTVEPGLCIASPAAFVPDGIRTVRLRLEGAPARLSFAPDPGTADLPGREPGPDEPAMLLLSSGSTGAPKCVTLRQSGVAWTATALARAFGIGPEHVELIVSPLTHSGAWQRAAATLVAGGRLVIYEGPVSIAGILEMCEHHAVRGFYTPPPVVRYLLQLDAERVRRSLAACRSIEIGSAPLRSEELARLVELLPDARVFVHFGLTECSRGTVLDARARPDKLGTVGRPLPGARVSVCDERDRPVPPGARGRIRLSGPQMAAGYWGDPERTAERFVDGWIRTGDVGSLDEEGFLTFLGRDDDMITSAGYSFFPLEAEEELGPVPGVRAYQIAGVPDPKGVAGQLPWAFVVPSRPEAWRPESFLSAAKSRLPPYMVPRRVIVVRELPTTGPGKPDRRETVRRFAGEE